MPQPKKTRGQATAIGAILFFTIAILLIGFMYEMYNVQAAMSQFDTNRAQERLEISDVLFGDQKTYSSPTPTIMTGSGTDPFSPSNINSTLTSGSAFPVPNMNFTYNRNGWLFQSTSGAKGVTAAFVQDEGNPTPGSRPGSIYSSLQGKGLGPYWLNWTCYFTYSGGQPLSAYYSWARNVANWTQIETSTIYVTLQGPTSGSPTTIRSASVNSTSPDQGAWFYETQISLPVSLFSASGTYSLSLALRASTKNSPKAKIWMSFDDVGIVLETRTGWSTDWCGTFKLSEAPIDVTKLKLQYTGHYSTLVSQTIYIWDYEVNQWHELSRTAVKESDLTLGPFEISDLVQRYVSPLGDVNVRIRAEADGIITCYADQLLLIDHFKDRTKFTIQIKNTGSSKIDIVSIWINNFTNHERITLNPIITLAQGETYTYTNSAIGEYFSTYTYEIKAVTQRGNMETYTIPYTG